MVQRFSGLFPDAHVVCAPVPPFAALAVGFCVAQLGLNRAPKGTIISHCQMGAASNGWSFAKKGTLTAKEQVELDNYERVGHVLSLMKAKARRSLEDGQDNGTAKSH